jgi:hypothetical protein
MNNFAAENQQESQFYHSLAEYAIHSKNETYSHQELLGGRCYVIFFFETGFHYVTQAGMELPILLPQSP